MTTCSSYIGIPASRFAVMPRTTEVEPAPVRRHVATLVESGMTLNMIARAAGLSARPVWNLMNLDPDYILKPTAEAIMTVTQRPSHHQAIVLSYGLRRRMEALAVMGWDVLAIAEECNYPHYKALHRARDGVRTQWQTHAMVAEAYERISHIRRGDVRAELRAQRRGYLSPFMWDDIDDYFEKPTAVRAEPVADVVLVQRILDGKWSGVAPKLERQAAFEILQAQGLSAAQIGERLDVTARTVQRLRSAA
ncbi:hypothetical protein [Rhodococcus globerulus]|uniref:hypothetical protein n=1 Tax=Rhodococcus globerulus TaxID=33008 RepID=UPI001C573AEF|nr:hypothetical protein [Rhodococcus globerulus]QXW04039.1 hypothetical protein KYT97_08470 [Rhodococcus globerulus]